MIDVVRAAAAIVAATVLGTAGAAPDPGTGREIVIEGMKFVPGVLTVRRGETVRWVNRDLVAHTATARDRFDSGGIAAGAAWSFVARTPGRIDYVCTLHPTMKATLVVE